MDNTTDKKEMMMENKLHCHHLDFEGILYEGFKPNPKNSFPFLRSAF